MRYKIGSQNRGSQFIDIELTIELNGEKTTLLQLPKWRPGRYEFGNFAKNIRGFKVVNEKKKHLNFIKINSHCWQVETENIKTIKVIYQYYAHELNAGSTWVDDKQLYINPVNCLLFDPSRINSKCFLNFDLPQNYIFATSLEQGKKNTLEADNYDELADSPVICSPDIKHACYKVGDVDFHIWIQGECKPAWEKLISDFTLFTKTQLEIMGNFPLSFVKKGYHFLFQILPQQSYHGVEHLNSTVITLGPGYQIMESDLYDELLGVSSHELFHAWNVKSIRPLDMLPYDFTKENYTELGWLTEGVTTYCGDLFLKKAGIFNEEKYFSELHKLFDRHSFNDGRLNYSVCESSFDSWLDGYVKGIPNRKSSIYTEGALLALCIDLMLIENSKGQNSLKTVLQSLFENYAKHNNGITEEIFIKEAQAAGAIKIQDLFNNYYHKAVDYYEVLAKHFKLVGIELKIETHKNYLAAALGCFCDNSGKVLLVANDSPADLSGISVNDTIISINDLVLKNNANHWGNYFSSDMKLLIQKEYDLKEIELKASDKRYFQQYRINKLEKPSLKQKNNLNTWLNN